MLLAKAQVELDEKTRDQLIDAAIQFRLGGGVVTLTEWSTLSQAERDALIMATASLAGEPEANSSTGQASGEGS